MAAGTTKKPRKTTSDDVATKYAKDVVAGKIVAGPLVRAACRRHLKDLIEGPKRGLKWSLPHVDRIVGFFRDCLTLSDGEHDGKPFILTPFQVFIVGNLFGWLTSDGVRRFRNGYLEMGKGCGKSPILAGIGLYMLVADGEAGAECYAAAVTRDQAKIIFRDAVRMVDGSPELAKRITKSGDREVFNLAYLKTGSYFRPVSSEGRGLDGKRVHFAAIDEVHEHPTDVVVNKMRAGTKGRRQAMIVEATNSGYDRNSVCWHHHEYSRQILEGEKEDDGWFAYVCALDIERTEIFYNGQAVRHMSNQCTCECVQHTQIEKLSREICANNVMPSGIGIQEVSAVLTILTAQFEQPDYVQRVTTAYEHLDSRLNKNSVSERAKSDGLTKTKSGSENIKTSGLPNKLRGIGDGWQKNKNSKSSELKESRIQNSFQSKVESVPFADESLDGCALTTTIDLENIVDYCVNSVIPDSVFSAILSKLLNLHSSTCNVLKKCSINSNSVKISMPADDPLHDPKCWIKANPNLGVSITVKYLEEQVREAIGMPSKESLVLRLNFCVWVDAANPWIGQDLWRAGEEDFPLEMLLGRECFGGLDLSGSNDLTAFVLAFPFEEGIIRILPFFWTPEATLLERERKDQAPYSQWVRESYLFTTPGRSVDYGFVAVEIDQLRAQYNLQSIAFDPYRIKYFERDLEAQGVAGVVLTPHGQGYYRSQESSLWMPRSVDKLEEKVSKGLLRYRKNPLLTWNSASAVLMPDPKGNRIFSKRESTGRIDGIVAAAMAVGNADTGDVVGKSFWET